MDMKLLFTCLNFYYIFIVQNNKGEKKTEKEKCFSFLSKTRKSTHYIFLNEFHKVYV